MIVTSSMSINYNIEVSPTFIDEDIINKLQERLLKNIGKSAVSVDNFQQSISALTGSPEVLAVSSGTAALHLALLALGIRKGDHIACSTFTFVASVNAICYVNAHPVFIDSEISTGNMCPELLRKAVVEGIKSGNRLKAVILVHAYGFPAQIEEIINICQEYEIPVIEDAASALGSTYKHKALGTFGTIGILSFNYNKIITTTGGGALLTNNQEIKEKATYYSNQAKSWQNGVIHRDVGYNYKLSGMAAELGFLQMPQLQQKVALKRNVFSRYKSELNNHEDIKFLEEPVHFFSNRWITTMLCKEIHLKDRIKDTLLKNNIEVRDLWKPMHKQPVFSSCHAYNNGYAEIFYNTGLCLPSGIDLKKSDQERIIDIVLSNFK
ncbi:MAG: DegT/DnrJ/EryC1/StrS family aminotransferase [Bacteroidota bacterium]|nr:DegT/DnrJ/EryC1/StrS family aminotransferase [Bacteroidota bacterium]